MINDLPFLRPRGKFGMQNAGWCYDAYPDLKPLLAKTSVEIANLEGPGVITCVHITQPIDRPQFRRGIIIEAFFDDSDEPAIRAPLADFFADGLNGLGMYFSTPFVEKLPDSYNCYMLMPFAKSARIVLTNETDIDWGFYSFVEHEKLPKWNGKLGYLHARWQRVAFQLTPKTIWNIVEIKSSGHLIGCNWSIVTNEPLFKPGFKFVMEGNVGYSIDGEPFSRVDYLGSEDSFGFSWGFRRAFCGLYSGISYVEPGAPGAGERSLAKLAIYRFRNKNAIAFNKSLSIRVDWASELRGAKVPTSDLDWCPEVKKLEGMDWRELVEKRAKEGGCWVDYSTCYYWYDKNPDGPQPSLPPLAQRVAEFLGPITQ